MSGQEFATTDVLALEIADDPAPGESPATLRNYVKDPRGDGGGAWFWSSPVEQTAVDAGVPGIGFGFRTVTAQAGVYFTTLVMPARPGATHVRAEFLRASGVANVGARIRIERLDADRNVISSTAQSALVAADDTFGNTGAQTISGAPYLRLRVDLYRSGGAALNAADAVNLSEFYLIQGSNAEVTASELYLADGWTDVLGPTHEITVERSELNLGTLTATILDADLDPSTSGIIRKGKPIRLRSRLFESEEDVIFTGEILNAKVTYDLEAPAGKRARIQLQAVDQATVMSNTPRSQGVTTIDELRWVLEGVGVPWNVNGERGHIAATPGVVATNENAKAIDQVAITRDSQLGYAWFDRKGVVQIWDAAEIDPTPIATLDESAYNPDVVVDFDTDQCINTVEITYLHPDPATGETEEIKYGPYIDAASIDEWRPHSAEFTVQGIPEDAATLAAYAGAILAANAIPVRRVLEATVPIRTTDELDAWALRDLLDMFTVDCAAAGITGQVSRVQSVTHRITLGKWLVTFGFAAEGGVAQPQVTPDLPPAASTWWPETRMLYGAKAKCPADFLVMDGSGFDVDQHPNLAAHLISLGLPSGVLPNMTDVFPIGAGTKAVGTSGGAPTHALIAANLPPHTHPILRGSDEGTSGTRVKRSGNTTVADAPTSPSTGTSTPVDHMPPWRAVYFIIRAG